MGCAALGPRYLVRTCVHHLLLKFIRLYGNQCFRDSHRSRIFRIFFTGFLHLIVYALHSIFLSPILYSKFRTYVNTYFCTFLPGEYH